MLVAGVVHEFSLVIERDVPLAGAELAALRPQGCVLISRGDDGKGVAVFETATGTYSEAVERAIHAVEALGAGTRVTEITGEPLPMSGVRIRTTLTREQWESLGQRSVPARVATRIRSSRLRWWPVYGFVIALLVSAFVSSSVFTGMAVAGVVLVAVLFFSQLAREVMRRG